VSDPLHTPASESRAGILTKCLQETQLSPTNHRATHLCKCNGVADPKIYAPTPYTLPRQIW